MIILSIQKVLKEIIWEGSSDGYKYRNYRCKVIRMCYHWAKNKIWKKEIMFSHINRVYSAHFSVWKEYIYIYIYINSNSYDFCHIWDLEFIGIVILTIYLNFLIFEGAFSQIVPVFYSSFFFFLSTLYGLWDLSSHQGWNTCPLQ